MKKVLIVSQEFPPKGGGAGQVAYNIASYLIKQGYQIEIVTVSDMENTEEQLFFVTYAKYIPKFFIINFAIEIYKKRPESFDYIILNDIGAVITASLFFSKKLLKKCLVFMHGSEPENILLSSSLYWRILNIKNKYYRTLTKCKNIIAVSNYMKRKFISLSGWDILSDKIMIIPNAIDFTRFYKDSIDLHKKYDIPIGQNIIYSASRITEKKGYGAFLKIFKQLLESKTPYHWIISGDGPYLKTLIETSRDLGIDNSITYTGYLSADDLRKHYSSVDVFVLLSEYEEAFGLVYLEACACGTPSIALRKGGTIEAIQDGITGFLVENSDECFTILKQFKYKDLANKKFEAFYKAFNYDTVYKQLLNLLL